MDAQKVVDEIQSLKNNVHGLSEKYPKSPTVFGAGVERAEIQIPWICRTLDEASEALTKGRDPFGNPITSAQVESGLKQLVAYVRDPSYGTLMEMAYPGIDKPLQACMDELEKILANF
jgi:hypothetical protein